MLAQLLSFNTEIWVAFGVVFLSFMLMWYKGKLPTAGELQDLTTILNSRGGNILILSAASVFFFYRSEHMYYAVVQMIKDGTIGADNGIALNGLTFDTGAFGSAFGALLKTMSPEAVSPASVSSSSTITTSRTVSTHPQHAETSVEPLATSSIGQDASVTATIPTTTVPTNNNDKIRKKKRKNRLARN